MKNIALTITCLFIFNSVIFGQTESALTALKGTYQGQVFNGDDLDPVLTTFRLSEGQKLSGIYAMGEEDGIATGTLSEFKWESDYVLVCTWQDKYGRGTLRILFSADLSMFRGFWGTSSKATLLPWDGVKQK
ncbi:hypothetical protein N9496_05735 [Akkermansiaceae bacterium]|nr:hypothetical protein [Akkermansiaceae bacterium]